MGKGDEPLPSQELCALPIILGEWQEAGRSSREGKAVYLGGKDIWDQPPGTVQSWGSGLGGGCVTYPNT